jgi:heme/copper-type cytochrome/quinol oxidase subunit 3
MRERMLHQSEPDPSPLPAASKLAAGMTLFLGVFTTIFAAAHVYGVMVTATTKNYTYDFRLAALYIVGITMVAAGVLCIAAVRELARGRRIGWERALYGTVLLLLVTVPLGPIQPDLAPAFVTFGGMNLVALVVLALLAARRRLEGS